MDQQQVLALLMVIADMRLQIAQLAAENAALRKQASEPPKVD